jgi:hypothetical protein
MLAGPLHADNFPSMFGNRSMIPRSLILGVAFIACASAANAQPPQRIPVAPTRQGELVTPAPGGTCPPFLGCPDDYCRKPFPRFWQVQCGGPDDYCPKPFPRILHLPCGGPDDYCCKPLPRIDRPLASDYYKCVDQGWCDKCSHGCAQGANTPRSELSQRLTAPR